MSMRLLPLLFLLLALIPTLEAQTNTVPQVTITFATGDSVPGATNTNASFVSFGNPAFNTLNGVAFQATVKETDTVGSKLVTNTWIGIWADDVAGNRNLIVRSGSYFGFASYFTSFSDPVYNNSNAVAFIGTVTEPTIELPIEWKGHNSTPSPSITTGIWTSQLFQNTNATSANVFPVITFYGTNTPTTNWWTNTTFPKLLPQFPSNLTMVTSLGSQAPGYTNKATFSSFDRIALPDQGGVVLLATVSTSVVIGTNPNYIPPLPPSTNGDAMPFAIQQPFYYKSQSQQGIWAQDTTGTLQLITHQGGTLNVGGTNKTIASLSFLNSANPIAGQTRSFNQDTGNLFYTAKFTDGTQAGVKVIFP